MADEKQSVEQVSSLLYESFNEFCSKKIKQRKYKIIIERNGLILLWLELKKILLVLKQTTLECLTAENSNTARTQTIKCTSKKHTSQNDNTLFQRLVFSRPPNFEVTSISVSPSGDYVALIGEDGLSIAELPRQWKSGGWYEGGKDNTICRCYGVGGSFFNHFSSTKINEAKWYPQTTTGEYLITLTSDNCIRFFDVSQPQHIYSTIKLFAEQDDSQYSMNSFASALGDVAISFDFASSISSSQSLQDPTPSYQIFVMKESGDVWLLYVRHIASRFQAKQFGPLPMCPPAEDNYGSEFCQLLCFPTTPPVVVMSSVSGRIHHCILLEDTIPRDHIDDHSRNRLDSSQDLPLAAKPSLFVYETIELDSSFVPPNMSDYDKEDADDEEMQEFVLLFKDTLNPNRYFSTSSGGVHRISLPWMETLQDMASEENELNHEHLSSADVSYILCTRLVHQRSKRLFFCGLISVLNHATLFLSFGLLSNGSVCLLTKEELFTETQATPEESRLEKSLSTTSRKFTSPLRNLTSDSTFLDEMKSILKKDAQAPILRSDAKGEDLDADEYYQLLTKATLILRKEYIEKLQQAKLALSKRCGLLREQKKLQEQDIELLENATGLRNGVEAISEKLDTITEKMNNLTDRLECVTIDLQRYSHVTSAADKEWADQIHSIEKKTMLLRRCYEQVQSKYQSLTLQSFPIGSKRRPSQLNTKQLLDIRSVLNNQSLDIVDLIETMKSLNMTVDATVH